MLQAYSNNLTIKANSPFVLNNVFIDKGCGERMSDPSTIVLEKRGVYLVEMDGFATPDTTTKVSVQLYVNNVAQPQAISTFVPALVPDTRTFGFKTFIHVFESNYNYLTAPTILMFMNGDTAVTNAHINVVITQIH